MPSSTSTVGFIKDLALLDEKIADTDFLDIGKSVEELHQKIISFDKNSFLGIVGAFGVGKSTLIEKVKLKHCSEENTTDTWIHFDAWQFPARKELWDGLILDTAKQVGKLENTKRHLEGNRHQDTSLVVNIGMTVAKIFSPILSPAIEMAGDGAKYFLQETPARRVFEMQEVFTALLSTIDSQRIVFVLEDVDRSGSDGLFFLETFKQFLNNTKLEKRVIVLVPISNDSYYTHLDTYLKCLDYVEFYGKSPKDLGLFVEKFYVKDLPLRNEILASLLSEIYRTYPDMTLRKIKLILRQANLNYIEFTRLECKPSSLVCIAVEVAKYIIKNVSDNTSYFQEWKRSSTIHADSVLYKLILAPSFVRIGMYHTYINKIVPGSHDSQAIYIHETRKPTLPRGFYIEHLAVPIPSLDSNGDIAGWNLPDFYFREL